MSNTYPDGSLTLHTNLYQINMMQVYWELGRVDLHAVFECYFREVPFSHGCTILIELEQLINYLENLTFSDSDIAYLRGLKVYPEDSLEYLQNFEFKATVRSARGGELIFANEPLIRVGGPLTHCQLVETTLLNMVNFQTLITAKAARIKSVIGEDPLLKFGARQAQELDAAVWGAKAAYIGGADATNNVRTGKISGIPANGTHAHSLVQSYGNDYEAFMTYAKTHKNCVFLVDTYDMLESGVPSVIRAAKELGGKINFQNVHIDSGDVIYVSKRVREQLDATGFTEAKIYASDDSDEATVLNLEMQEAKIDVWDVGTELITAYDQPTLGVVFRLVSIEDDEGRMMDTIKLSSNAEKVTAPGKRQVQRITQNFDGKSERNYVTLWDEDPQEEEATFIFHPVRTLINKTVRDFTARPVLQNIFIEGKRVYELPASNEIKEYTEENLDSLWREYKRDLNPQRYPVNLSTGCWNHKMAITERTKKNVTELHT